MFRRLENEVWALDRCCGCSNCVALCAKGMLSWGAGEYPVLEQREKALGLSHTILDSCTFCQHLCEEGCPRLEEEWKPLETRRVVAARTRGVVNSGEPADVVKHLLVAGMAAELIDGAILADVDPWTLQPISRVVESVGEVIETLGTSYVWAPTLSALNEAVYDRKLKNLAVAGSPCVSQALRKLQSSANERLRPYQRALRLNIATFCTGVYRPELVAEYLANQMGIAPSSVKRLVASPRQELLTVVLWDGTTHEIPLAQVEAYTRHGCARCDDFTGDSADIAVGVAGVQEGYSTLIVRSQAGEICLRNAIDFGLLEVNDLVDQAVLRAAAHEKERRQRAQSFDRMTIMMLDALAEPQKRQQVKQAFVRLYGSKKPGQQQREEENCNVTCGQC